VTKVSVIRRFFESVADRMAKIQDRAPALAGELDLFAEAFDPELKAGSSYSVITGAFRESSA